MVKKKRKRKKWNATCVLAILSPHVSVRSIVRSECFMTHSFPFSSPLCISSCLQKNTQSLKSSSLLFVFVWRKSNYVELFGQWSVKHIAATIGALQTDRYQWNPSACECMEMEAQLKCKETRSQIKLSTGQRVDSYTGTTVYSAFSFGSIFFNPHLTVNLHLLVL